MSFFWYLEKIFLVAHSQSEVDSRSLNNFISSEIIVSSLKINSLISLSFTAWENPILIIISQRFFNRSILLIITHHHTLMCLLRSSQDIVVKESCQRVISAVITHSVASTGATTASPSSAGLFFDCEKLTCQWGFQPDTSAHATQQQYTPRGTNAFPRVSADHELVTLIKYQIYSSFQWASNF